MEPPRIARAEGDLLFDEHGRQYIDLFTAHGTTWLGHGEPAVRAAVAEQLGAVWSTGALKTAALERAVELIAQAFPPSHAPAMLYSTGMEAVEFAIRVARGVTGRAGVVGFERSMHGKSLATAFLGWDNGDGVELPGFVRLPFLPDLTEGRILDRLHATLEGGAVAAVVVEPIQGSGGGHRASPTFHRRLQALCRDAGALLIFDEILTGFYRTGPRFVFDELGFVPDIVLIGKAMGNGFPVSGVVVDRRYRIDRRMLPGSTFSGNPLAAAAAAATLRRMQDLDMPRLVAGIERTVAEVLGDLPDRGFPLRGRGALWIIESPSEREAERSAVRLWRRGVAVGLAGRFLRILPSATIGPDRFRSACSTIRDTLIDARPGRDEP